MRDVEVYAELMFYRPTRLRVREELERATAAEAEARAAESEAAHSALKGDILEAENPTWIKEAAIMKQAMARMEGTLQAAENEARERCTCAFSFHSLLENTTNGVCR